jgi:CDP-glycerol glycerophosphotransferase
LLDERRNEFNSYIHLKELPGPVCYNVYEVIDVVKDLESISKEYENNYINALKNFNYNNDGNACKRVVEAVFNGINENIIDTSNQKKKLLFYPGSLKTNGITSSIISLLNYIDYDRYDVTILVDPKKNLDFENFIFNLKKINNKTKIIFISLEFNFFPKEYVYHNLILRYGQLNRIKIPKNLYSREIRRLLGNTHFDIFIDFGGYDSLITLLFAFSEINRKCMYLHNNMVGEYKLKYANLSVTFDLYRYYNKLITVSKGSKKENSVNFKEYGMDLDDKLTYVNNTVDHETVIKNSLSGRASEINNIKYYFTRYTKNNFLIDIAGIVAPIENNINFISIGRLSPEKDHKKLLTAFSRVSTYYKNVKLYILGDGPLKDDLINFSNDIGILDHVIFTGNLDNPHWLLNNCNCFVLSSNYEGQGIVILEAMILCKSVISTDIFGPRGILQGGYGKLVANNAEALAEAMIEFIEEGMDNKPFDYFKYNKIAMNQFYKEVCDEK